MQYNHRKPTDQHTRQEMGRTAVQTVHSIVYISLNAAKLLRASGRLSPTAKPGYTSRLQYHEIKFIGSARSSAIPSQGSPERIAIQIRRKGIRVQLLFPTSLRHVRTGTHCSLMHTVGTSRSATSASVHIGHYDHVRARVFVKRTPTSEQCDYRRLSEH